MVTILKIRARQISRATAALGLFRVIFLAGLVSMGAAGLFLAAADATYSLYVSGVYLIVILFLQVNRRDKTFLKIHFDNFRFVFLLEYFLLTFPLLICLIYFYQWILFSAVLATLLLIINLDTNPGHNSLNTCLQQLIPACCFEWKGGVRSALFFIFPLWITGMGTSFIIGSVPVVLFILGILSQGFLEKSEPVNMILAFEMGCGRFLKYKIKMQSALFSFLAMPLVIAFILFHATLWYIPVIEYLVLMNLQAYAILTKYAFYQPNSKSGAASVFGLIGLTGMILPVLLPLIWVLSIRFYLQSRKNLNQYLHDFN